ncbi:putative zinc-binding metallopeptidase [Rhodoferax saidenbachensis]|uniref:Zinc-ribbon domain-containing protein n=1 Tax=Rhodoferax saidenbachensis TaxID=1484693 RepID=A0ABU1ZS38_9BURK|nr:putative zinc-binding metallopeptidase [Rhodoferax saidenbachensis]MDR7308367.1 hypothetical protein [Rhodoferax saidenbachensis]
MEMVRPQDTASGHRQPLTHRIGQCQCGYPVFFRNHLCLHCGRALGYEPDTATILSLEALDEVGNWRAVAASAETGDYRRCANFSLAPQCNWLIPVSQGTQQTLCRCCRLNRMVPDQSVAENVPLWHAVEVAKRRLVSSLIALGLPVASRIDEDPARGLAFDLLVDAVPLPVTTGHRDGIITVNVNEADDAAREAIRSAMHEPYRTVLGHVRHESGHYYWSRLLEGSLWHEPFRALFGDEQQDYAAALQQHYANGPDPAWADNSVSAYASSHPWEDWAETWAHYLHMVDTLDTAVGAGMAHDQVDLLKDPFETDVLYRLAGEDDAVDTEFLAFFNAWVGLTSVLNEFSLGMGLPDFYPFVLSKSAITKLHFVHRFIRAFGESPVP